MELAQLEARAQGELDDEKTTLAVGEIKERLKEIALARVTLRKLQEQYEQLLAKSVDEVAEDLL